MIIYAREMMKKKYLVKIKNEGDFSIFTRKELMSLIAEEKDGEYFVEFSGNNDDNLSLDMSKNEMFAVLQRICDDVRFYVQEDVLYIELTPPEHLYSVVDKFTNHGEKMDNPFYGSTESDKRKYTHLAGAMAVRPYNTNHHDVIMTNYQTENFGNTKLNVEKKDSVFSYVKATETIDKSLQNVIFVINGKVVDPDSLIYENLIKLTQFSGHNILITIFNYIMSAGDQSSNFRPSADNLRQDCNKISREMSLFLNVSSVNYCLNERLDHFDLIFNIKCAEGNEIENVEIVCDEMNAVTKAQISQWAFNLSRSMNNMIKLYKDQTVEQRMRSTEFVSEMDLVNEFRNKIMDYGFEDCDVEKINNTLYIRPIITKSQINYKILLESDASVQSVLMEVLNTSNTNVDHDIGFVKTICKDLLNINLQTSADQEGFNKVIELRGNRDPCGWWVSNISHKSPNMISMSKPGVIELNLFVYFIPKFLFQMSALNGTWLGVIFDIMALRKEYDDIIRTTHCVKFSSLCKDKLIVLSVGSEIKPLKLMDKDVNLSMLYSLYAEVAVNFLSGFALKCKYDSFVMSESKNDQGPKEDQRVPRLAFSAGWKKSTALGSLNLSADVSVKSEYMWKKEGLDNHVSCSAQLAAVVKKNGYHICSLKLDKDKDDVSIPFLFKPYTFGTSLTYSNIWEFWNTKEVLGNASLCKVMIGHGLSAASAFNKLGQVMLGWGVCIAIAIQENIAFVLYVAYDILEKEFDYGFASMSVSLQQQPQYQPSMYVA